jgi:glycosyltransferase involved in cell wall biosynthesis
MSDPVAIVIPSLNFQDSLDKVLEEIPRDQGLHIYVVDDGSSPPLVAAPGVHLIRHPINRGYGAAQKSGYAAAIADGARRVVMLHGDGQYPTEETLALAEGLDEADCVLGSRLLYHDGKNIPAWRRWGNRMLTQAANLRFGQGFSDLHTGARAFRTDALEALPLASFSDDFVFDQQVLVGLISRGMRIVEQPMVASYDDTVQSISFLRSITYGFGCLWAMLQRK